MSLEDDLAFAEARGSKMIADNLRARIRVRDSGQTLQEMYVGGPMSRGNAERTAARKAERDAARKSAATLDLKRRKPKDAN